MRKRSLLALMILLCLLLTGCYAFDSESFYALPKRSEQFSELQAALKERNQRPGFRLQPPGRPAGGPGRRRDR